MQALLLATGRTDRLSPLSEIIPSPILPLVGRPVMLYLLELLARQNFKRVHVSLFNSGGYIESFFKTGNRWGINLEYMLQPEDWGSAGSVRWARQHLEEPFVVLPADTLIDIDFAPLFQQHIENKCAATIVMAPQRGARASLISNKQEKNKTIASPENGVETGVFILDPLVIDYIPSRSTFDLSTQLIPALSNAGLRVERVMTNCYWNPLDTFMDYQEAQNAVLESAQARQAITSIVPFYRYPSIEGRQIQEAIWINHNTNIHPLARLIPPVYIGENCYIRKGAEIGPHTVIEDNVIVDEDASITNSTVLDHTYIGKLVNINDRVINKKLMIDILTDETVVVTDQHLLSETYQAIDDSGIGRLTDIALALLMFLVTLPISVLISLLVVLVHGSLFRWHPRTHLSSPDPAMGQKLEIRSFRLLHFNTRDNHGKLSSLGKFLEKWDVYRLPELWNVIKGDIRFVGVKPLSPEENSQVKEAWQKTRYEASPGFIGLWYVQTTAGSDFDEILISDAFYTATRTWSGDMKLVFQSVRTWLRRLFETAKIENEEIQWKRKNRTSITSK